MTGAAPTHDRWKRIRAYTWKQTKRFGLYAREKGDKALDEWLGFAVIVFALWLAAYLGVAGSFDTWLKDHSTPTPTPTAAPTSTPALFQISLLH